MDAFIARCKPMPMHKQKQHIIMHSLSPTERTPIVLQLCLRSQIGLWTKYYYALLNITHHFSYYVKFTNIVVWSTGTYGIETKYRVPTVRGQCIGTYTSITRFFHCSWVIISIRITIRTTKPSNTYC